MNKKRILMGQVLVWLCCVFLISCVPSNGQLSQGSDGSSKYGAPRDLANSSTEYSIPNTGDMIQRMQNIDDDSQLLALQYNQARKAQVTVCARVQRILPDDTKGIPHERFLIHLKNDTTVLVAHDTALAPRVPLHEGDLVRIHGEYIWNEKGGVIHWTHHSPNGRHDPGYIDFNGKRYQ